ncbi:MAG: hypothetical protein BLM47_07215 [Candidatus Reconcilbacillus cellulovorans]|uniref:Uncharacterized protein n=1 Tax=Candidatus Reconcilbacillus cellulovorans TaxID=1906605 RepID=A0A2A6E0J5_9BACL|nr:MAG: hypothetical protein BLM47_07215 [Candidatus Reconcilbacillus cellulovorans]
MFLDKPEEIVKDYLEKNHFLVKKIDEKIVGQKPDFEVFLNNDLVFYCEVKSLRGDLDINKMIESEEPNEPISRHDPIFNSIANRIHEASKQFLAVNPKHNIPNVLSFVNKYFIPQSIGIDDLFLTLYGYKTGDKLISYIKKKLEKDYMRVWK